MESAVKILVVSFSTRVKTLHLPQTIAHDTNHQRRIAAGESSRFSGYLLPAAQMYTGSHHKSVMAGVGQVRRMLGSGAASVIFLSPVYGTVGERELIAPYSEHFDQKVLWIINRARKLDIPTRIRAGIRGWPLVIFLLHRRVLRAIEPPLEPEPGQRLVFLTAEESRGLLAHRGVTVVPVTPSDSGLFGARGAALKGRLFEFYAATLSGEGEKLWKRTLQDDLPTTFMSAARRAMAKQQLFESQYFEANPIQR
jgi:hypothetical protein